MKGSGEYPVVVLRSNDVCFLGILRSCYAAGIEAIPVTFTWPGAPTWYSESSRYFSNELTISNPFTNGSVAAMEFRDIVARLCREYHEPVMVIASSDTNLMFLLDHYEMLAPYIRMFGHQDLHQPREDVLNKQQCAELLSLNVPHLVPVTAHCASHADIENAVDSVVYPAIYKPTVKDYGQTFYRMHKGNKAIECSSPSELRHRLTVEMDNGFDLIVQEKLFFDSVYDEIPFYLYANANGNITMAGNGVKELIDPFPFGTAITLRFAWFPELLVLAREVVNALSYRGILMIEFVREKKNGDWKVVEVNPRHWLFNGFYQRIGLNYTDHLVKDMSGILSDQKLVTASEEVLDSHHVHVDLLALAKNWAESEKQLDIAGYLSRLDAIGGTISSAFLDPKDSEPGILRINDMLKMYQWPSTGRDAIISRLGG